MIKIFNLNSNYHTEEDVCLYKFFKVLNKEMYGMQELSFLLLLIKKYLYNMLNVRIVFVKANVKNFYLKFILKIWKKQNKFVYQKYPKLNMNKKDYSLQVVNFSLKKYVMKKNIFLLNWHMFNDWYLYEFIIIDINKYHIFLFLYQ